MIAKDKLGQGIVVDGYVLAASVLDTFDPDELQPLPDQPAASRQKLLALAVVNQAPDSSYYWRLPDNIRESAITELAIAGRLQYAVGLNRLATGIPSLYQRVFESYVAGSALTLGDQSLEELQASLQAVRLLKRTGITLPDESEINSMVLRKAFVRQFELLADNHFVGRRQQLTELERFVDVLPSGSVSALRRAASTFASEAFGFSSVLKQPPLLVTGMGGIGKSAFLSKFLLNHINGTVAQQLAFAYIDFDRTSIWPDEPLTVLTDICHQLAIQIPEHRSAFTDLQRSVSAELAYAQGHGVGFDSSESFRNESVQISRHKRHLKYFADICETAFRRTHRTTLLLILDTFEEVTHRVESHERILWNFIADLQDILPRLRVIVSGRADPALRGTNFIRLELPELDEESSVELLEKLCRANPRTSKAIVRRVGGHPLCLRLAAQLVSLVAERGNLDPSNVPSAQLFTDEWHEYMREGFLYRRIVSHIDDPAVRSLADPGLVLREITPNLIYEVLNEPCDLRLGGLAEAADLFSRLQKLNSLVTTSAQGSLRHRPELRSKVLPELLHSNGALCREIWLRAVDFYQRSDEPQARSEEMYCRLMLDQRPEILERCWRPGLERQLLSARAEMPSRARQFLDLMVLVQEGSASAGESSVDEALIAEQMKLLLSRGRPGEALDLFRATRQGRRPAFTSPLFPIFVRALAQSGESREAITLAAEGMNKLEMTFRSGSHQHLELLLLACQVATGELNRAKRRPPVLSSWWGPAGDSDVLTARSLWGRFRLASHASDETYLLFHIAINLLQVIDLEESGRPGVNRREALSKRGRACAARALRFMDALKLDDETVEGMLLLRAFAWLGIYAPADRRIRRLIEVPQALVLFGAEYAELIETEVVALAEQRSFASVTRLLSFFRGLEQPWRLDPTLLDALSMAELVDIAKCLKTQIAVRDLQAHLRAK